MDRLVPCYCNLTRLDPDESDFVLNGVPICRRECLEKAEKSLLTNKRDTIKTRKGYSWNGA